jgi:hypothetical protein
MQPDGRTTTMRARVRRFRSVPIVLAVLAAFPVGGTFGATNDAAGWWSRTSSPLPINPTSPQVEEGQLHVQGHPSGPTAIAAIRWTLLESESAPMLTLTPSDGSLVPSSAIVVACRATTPWSEAHGGPWDEAPESDCTTGVEGTVAEDRSSIEFALGPLVDGTSLDIVLQPGQNENGAGSTFSLTFDRPGPDALTTTRSSSGGDAFGGGFTSAPSPSPSPAPSSSSSGGSFAPPAAPAPSSSFAAPATEQAAPALPEEAAAPASETPSLAATRPAASSSSGTGDRARSLGLAVLLAGVAVAARAWTASAPTAAGAPAPAEPAPGPLGRFSGRRRTAPPATS